MGLDDAGASGVTLVSATGAACRDFKQVDEINLVVAEIATAAREQAAGLDHVNAAIAELDKTTQRNATMAAEFDGGDPDAVARDEQPLQLARPDSSSAAATRRAPLRRRSAPWAESVEPDTHELPASDETRQLSDRASQLIG